MIIRRATDPMHHRPTSADRLLRLLCGWALFVAAVPAVAGDWFEALKRDATAAELYRVLYAMPKGGDLHQHLTGSVHAEWYWELALAAGERGYRYFTKTQINNCRYGSDEFGADPYLLLFRTITEREYQALPPCEQGEYEAMADLDSVERQAWLDSVRLDKPHEGRSEFFETHWQRLNSLVSDPELVAEALYLNMVAFGAEGVRYLEPQVPIAGFREPDGTPMHPDRILAIYLDRLAQPDAQATGVAVRMQVSLLRFLPNAEEHLRGLYAFAAAHPEVVAVNMVGREDNDKGYPLRFLETLRELRRQHHGVRLSIHGGEVDEPNEHVRDTLLLGAERIGHGVNLITDPDTLLLMRGGPYLVEINLVSNLLLEYVDDYAQHPFPEYLRIGIPVALSTDDRGMWDSTMTDEFFIAVTEYNLSWDEVKTLSRNSLQYSFAEPALKASLLADYDRRIAHFEARLSRDGLDAVADVEPVYRGFTCRRFGLCADVPAADETAAADAAVAAD